MKTSLATFTRAALAAVALCASTAAATERSEVPERYRWNVADLYASDAAWAAERDALAARVKELPKWQGRLGESAAVFHDAIVAMWDTQRDLTRLAVYASMRSDEDQRVAATREMDQAASQLFVDFSSAVSWMRPEILALGADRVWGYVAADARLAPYRPWLDDVLRYAPHTRSAAEEKIAAQAAIMAGGAGRTYSTFANADLPYPEITLSTGERVRLDAAAYTKHRASPVRADRLAVFEAFWSKFKAFERTIGTTLDAQVKAHLFEKNVRNFGSCLEAALFPANIPTAVYRQLVKDVNENLPTLHRYLRLRQRMMGVERLGYEDLYAPIVKSVELRFTPEQAHEIVVQAVAPLGPQYVAVIERGQRERWIDYMPSTGKRSGAYSTGAYGVHPYQLLNFTGLYEEVSTLAHEWGHSVHTYLSDQAQPYVTHDYATFVAEVASTLNENLLLHHMLSRTTDRDTRLFLLGSYLDGMRTTLFRQTLFAEFELAIHEMAERGEPLTGEKMSALYLGLLRRYYGHDAGVCEVKDLYGVEWAYIHHFYYNFYVYQYATSLTASSQIAANMRADARAKKPTTKSRDAYLKMLSSGSSKYPIDLLREAGVDMTSSGPFRAAMAEMNAVMDEMEKLLASK
uniref:Oligopeptidase F n=1 Tax=Eiseniibacteriota bacterium TaxID=2212470 RepID=A0A832HYV6_UNCEI